MRTPPDGCANLDFCWTWTIAWFIKAAEQGVPNAQFYLAAAYNRGEGVPQNEVQGLYAWLCRNDRAWLSEYSPRKQLVA